MAETTTEKAYSNPPAYQPSLFKRLVYIGLLGLTPEQQLTTDQLGVRYWRIIWFRHGPRERRGDYSKGAS